MIHRHILHDAEGNKHVAEWDDGLHPDVEPEEHKSRYQLFPIQDKTGYDFFQTQVRAFWTPYELDFSNERASYKRLNPAARRMLAYTLAFFSASDLLVNDRLMYSILKDPRITAEMNMALTFQSAMETIHTETYSLLLDTMIEDQSLKNDLFAGLEIYPSIKAKQRWYFENSHPNLSFAHRLLTQLMVEGVFFSSSFALISWLRIYTKGDFGALTASNSLVMRDEHLHSMMSLSLLKKHGLIEKALARRLFKEATSLEIAFIEEAYKEECLGMTCKQMSSHVKFVTNYWCNQLGIDKLFPEITETFAWLEQSTIESKSNFFELKETNYAKSADIADEKLTFNEDF